MIRRMRTIRHRLRRLHGDRAGQVTVEWALVLLAVALPMYYISALGLRILVGHYQMVTFLENLPFP